MWELDRLTSLGDLLDLSGESFGWLRSSADVVDDAEELRRRFGVDGYLFLPAYLDVELVTAARARLLERLSEMGLLALGFAVAEGMAKQPWVGKPCHHLIQGNEPLQRLLYSGRMMDVYERLFGGAVRHFDFTWMRVIGPGMGTAPHADSVYMNRGSQRLMTSWTPLMEIPLDIGGLMVMPGSHRVGRLKKYFDSDVDTVCTNIPNRTPQDVHGWVGPMGDGKLSRSPAILQKKLGLPWLTAKRYQPGDVLLFGIHTLHASIDNTSDRVRLSTDTRYQPASDAVDERWVGAEPMGHGEDVRRGLIC